MTIRVTRAVLDALASEARAARPAEACGLLFGHAASILGHQAATNVHSSPHTHFEIDPQALIDAHRAMRQGGPRLVGYYHSHPHGPPEPSATDQAMAAGDGMIWAIVGSGLTRFWHDDENGFLPLSYTPV